MAQKGDPEEIVAAAKRGVNGAVSSWSHNEHPLLCKIPARTALLFYPGGQVRNTSMDKEMEDDVTTEFRAEMGELLLLNKK
jgi:hypothetical protein